MGIFDNGNKTINYNRKNIELSYKPLSDCTIDTSDKVIIRTMGSGKGKNYYYIEQEAQLYLIKNALEKVRRDNLNLVGIIGIKQKKVEGGVEGSDIEFILTGKAVFERN